MSNNVINIKYYVILDICWIVQNVRAVFFFFFCLTLFTSAIDLSHLENFQKQNNPFLTISLPKFRQSRINFVVDRNESYLPTVTLCTYIHVPQLAHVIHHLSRIINPTTTPHKTFAFGHKTKHRNVNVTNVAFEFLAIVDRRIKRKIGVCRAEIAQTNRRGADNCIIPARHIATTNV